MDKQTLAKFKQSLEDERDRLAEELKSIATPNPHMKGDWDATYPQFDPDSAGVGRNRDEEADEVEEYEARLGLEHSHESRLLRVTHALHRIEQGSYGACRQCKKEIPLDRLEANPAAEYHVEHEPT